MAAEAVMSTERQVIVPKEICDSLNWHSGTRLTFEKTPAGVLVKEAVPEKTGSIEDILGILRYDGPPVSIEDMDQAIAEEVARRHAAGRY